MSQKISHSFAQVPSVNIPRSTFNRDHAYKTTFDSGLLIPFFVDEVLPGDTFNVNATIFARLLSSLEKPVMDNMYLDTFFFFVPNRLVWDNFQKFMGEKRNPNDSTDYLIPQVELDFSQDYSVFRHSMADYFGLPYPTSQPAAPYSVNALPFRAYNLIWNEWFRSQDLQDSVDVPVDDGPDNMSDYELLRRGKRHDYFTSALPWPQKGPAVEFSLGDYAPVVSNNLQPEMLRLSGTPDFSNPKLHRRGPEGIDVAAAAGLDSNTAYPVKWGAETGLRANLAAATSINVNDWRLAVQMQRMLERDARGGTRYVEILRSHFGVVSPDARLQRPEYLGGATTPIRSVPVAQTSASTDQPTPQGNLSAFGLVSSQRNGFSKSFVEHGFVIGLCCVRADLTYQQGLPRMFSRRTKHDLYWPVFSHLGEQPVLNKEIYFSGDDGLDDAVFGYQERHAEYRYAPSKITGALRSQDPTSLDVWHLSQYFQNRPLLNEEFIQEVPPVKRILAVTSEPDFIMDVAVRNRTTRPMPVFSVPGMADHF